MERNCEKMSVSHLFLLFFTASFLGWIYECIYCTVKTTRWQNRGFLFGPVCPIYGFGVLGAFLLFSAGSGMKGSLPAWPAVFGVCALGSAILEYLTSFLLEKLFHARWWDYSKAPLNINGRICLPATCGFGAAGVLLVKFAFPFMDRCMQPFIRGAVSGPVEDLFSLLLMGLLGIDLGLTISSVTSLNETLERIGNEFDEMMESRYAPIGKRQRFLADKISDAGHSAAERIETAGQTAAEKLGTAGQTAAEKIETARQTVTDRIESVQDTMSEKIEDTAAYMNLLRRRAAQLSRHQSKALMNIEVFSASGHKYAAEKMKEILLSKLPHRVKRIDDPIDNSIGNSIGNSIDNPTNNLIDNPIDNPTNNLIDNPIGDYFKTGQEAPESPKQETDGDTGQETDN